MAEKNKKTATPTDSPDTDAATVADRLDRVEAALIAVADASSKDSPSHPRNNLSGKVRDILGLTGEKPAEPAPAPASAN